MLIKDTESTLLVIDIQERLVPAMPAPGNVLKNTQLLLRAASTLKIPTLITEQYKKGLGSTVPEILSAAGSYKVIEKLHFSAMEEPTFETTLAGMNRKQVIIAGIEAHVCVLQTAADLLANNYKVFIVSDAIASRTQANKDTGTSRLRAAGAQIVTTEMVIFEWLGKAGTQEFKALLPLIK